MQSLTKDRYYWPMALRLAFGWWGVKTRAGSRMFGEMAAMIPFFVGVFGGLLVVVGAGLYAWQRIRG